MADSETIPVAESPEAELPLAEFVKRGNARDAGKDIPVLSAESPEPAPEPEPSPEPEPGEPEPRIAASTGEPDKRTKTGKRFKSIQAEIDAETARKYAAKTEADAEESRLVKLRADAAALAVRPPAQPPARPEAKPPVNRQAYARYIAMPDAPKIETYTGENAFAEWQFDVAEFVADKRFAENMQRVSHAQQVAQQQTKFTSRIQKEVANDAAFQQKLDSTPVDTRIIPYLHSRADGDEIMVYLVNHPQVAQRLTTLNPVEQIGQIGEIAGELKVRAEAVSRGPARPSVISNAKPPIKPLGSAPSVIDDDDGDDENLPLSQFVKRGNAKDPRINPRLVARR